MSRAGEARVVITRCLRVSSTHLVQAQGLGPPHLHPSTRLESQQTSCHAGLRALIHDWRSRPGQHPSLAAYPRHSPMPSMQGSLYQAGCSACAPSCCSAIRLQQQKRRGWPSASGRRLRSCGCHCETTRRPPPAEGDALACAPLLSIPPLATCRIPAGKVPEVGLASLKVGGTAAGSCRALAYDVAGQQRLQMRSIHARPQTAL